MIIFQETPLWRKLTGKSEGDAPDPVPIDAEQREQWFQQSEVLFSNGNIITDGVVLLTWLKLWKTDPKLLASVAEKYLETIDHIITATQRASAANWLNDLINQRLANNLMHSIGLITEEQRFLTNMWYDHIFALMWQKDFVKDTLGSLSTLGGDVIGAIGAGKP